MLVKRCVLAQNLPSLLSREAQTKNNRSVRITSDC